MLAAQIKRLAKHSAIYGLGGLVSRVLAVLLLPLYTSYLDTGDYGKIETLIAATTVLVIVLRLGISSAFFRFYFDSSDPERRVLVVRTSFWFTMTSATAGLVAGLVLDRGPLGVIVGNFLGTLCVYGVLLGYRRYQLGLQFDRALFREMNRFGMPLVPSQIAIWTLNFSDRFFIAKLKGQTEVGHYSIGSRVASAILLLLVAFRTAWPAFAYSIDDDREARRAYGFVLTYLLFVTCWVSSALGLLSPWLVHLLTAKPEDYSGAKGV